LPETTEPPTEQSVTPLSPVYRVLAVASTVAFVALVLLGIYGSLRDTGRPPELSIQPRDHVRRFAEQQDWLRLEREIEALIRLGVAPAERAAQLERLGHAKALRGDLDNAVLVLRSSLAMNPSSEPARRTLIATLIEAGRDEEVITDCEEYLRRFAGSQDIAHQLANALERTGHPQRAQDVRRRLAGRPPEAPELPCDTLTLEGRAARRVIFIVSESMRRDRVGAYWTSEATPGFDRFAQGHLRFDRGVTPAPETRAAVGSLLTGLLPSRSASGLAPPPSLAADFAARGFRTGAIVASPALAGDSALAAGFDHYDDSLALDNRDGRELTRRALAWIDQIPDGTPFFLYLHYTDGARPYGAFSPDMIETVRSLLPNDTRPVSAEANAMLATLQTSDGEPLFEHSDLSRKRMLLEIAYDAGLREFDHAWTELQAGLEARPAWEDTAVLVTADHGEAFFERGYGGSARALHEDELALPMAARLPGVTPTQGVVECSASLVDWRPTLCHYLDLPCEDDDGQSLLSGAPGQTSRFVLSEGVPGFPEHRALRNRRYKLIFEPGGRLGADGVRVAGDSGPYQLYDLTLDPKERSDLLADPRTRAASEPVFASLRAGLEAFPSPASEPAP
jgi:arylsulfatase